MTKELLAVGYNINELRDDPQAVELYLREMYARGAIFALQEVNTKALMMIADVIPGNEYQYIYKYRGQGGAEYDQDGCACLMLIPNALGQVEKYEQYVIPYDGSNWFPAVIQIAWINTEMGRIRMVNLHGTTTKGHDKKGKGSARSERFRRQMFASLTKLLDQENAPTILLGDFNTEINAPVIQELVEHFNAINMFTWEGINCTRTEATRIRAEKQGWPFQGQADGMILWGFDEKAFGAKAKVRLGEVGADHHPGEVRVRKVD